MPNGVTDLVGIRPDRIVQLLAIDIRRKNRRNPRQTRRSVEWTSNPSSAALGLGSIWELPKYGFVHQSKRRALLDMPGCKFYPSNIKPEILFDCDGDQLSRVESCVETVESCKLRFADGHVRCESNAHARGNELEPHEMPPRRPDTRI